MREGWVIRRLMGGFGGILLAGALAACGAPAATGTARTGSPTATSDAAPTPSPAPGPSVLAAWDFGGVTEAGVIPNTIARAFDLRLQGDWSAQEGSVLLDGDSVGSTPEGGYLDPGRQDVSVAAVLRLPEVPARGDSPNVIQKGFFGDPAQVKIQIKPGQGNRLSCRFAGSDGDQLLLGPDISLADGERHLVSCFRAGTEVGARVDGQEVRRTATIGSIANERPVTVGGRSTNDSSATDRLTAEISSIVWAAGSTAVADAAEWARVLAER